VTEDLQMQFPFDKTNFVIMPFQR